MGFADGIFPILGSVQGQLEWGFGGLDWWKVLLSMAGGLEVDDLQCPFHTKPFCENSHGDTSGFQTSFGVRADL